jgi:nucleoside-diphosphate-sugar epimerase
MKPETVYGVSKLAGEDRCRWYFENKDVDVRSCAIRG